MSDQKITIIRGIPGSGKSYLARELAQESQSPYICSADDFFGPDYDFDVSRLAEAHASCLIFIADCIDIEVYVMPLAVDVGRESKKIEKVLKGES